MIIRDPFTREEKGLIILELMVNMDFLVYETGSFCKTLDGMGFLALYANEKFFRDGHVKRQTTMTNLCFEGEKVLRLLNLSLDIITIRKPKQSKFRKICEPPYASKFEVFLSTSSCQDRYRVKKNLIAKI